MQKRTREQWQALFAEQAASGLSTRQFCAQHKLCSKYFSLRRRQFNVSVDKLSDAPASAFVRLRKAAPVALSDVSGVVTLRHGCCELTFNAVSPEWLSRLVVALA